MRITSRRAFLRQTMLGAAGALLTACAPTAPAAPTSAPAKPAATVASVPTAAPAPTMAPAPTAAPAAKAAPPAAAAPTTAPAAPTAVPIADGNFVVADGTEPSGFSPISDTGPPQHPVSTMFDGLVQWNDKMEAVPALATSWEPSQDGKTWTFKLRQGVKFHDGTPFNAQAVKTTVEHLLDKDTASPRRASYTLIKSIELVDDGTVRFVTDPPTPDFPFLMADNAVKIVSPTALQKFGKDFGRNPVGTGPYKFEEWIANDRMSAVANPDYWGPKPRVRRYVYRPIPEASGRVVALKTGEADVVNNLPAADYENLQQDPNLTAHATPGLTIVDIEPRMSKPPFNDVRVRTAINMAIDKNAIITSIMKGLARPLNTPSIPGLWGTADFDPIPFDPARAKQLITEAGFPDGIDVTLYYIPGRWAGDDAVLQAVQGYWANIGIRTKINKITQAELGPIQQQHPDTLPGVAFFLIKTSQFVDYHLYRMYHTDATMRTVTSQHYHYSNPEVDKLIDQERTTFDPAKRLPILKQAQELIWKDQPLVFLFHQVNIWGQRKNVSGFSYQPTGFILPGEVAKS